MSIIEEPLSMQSAYEQIRAWFSRPVAKFGITTQYESNIICVYRSSEDPSCRCSIGCLIPDQLYDKPLLSRDSETVGLFIEGKTVDIITGIDEDLDRIIVDGETGKLGFLERIQKSHDHNARCDGSISGFIETLDRLAREYGLQVVSTT